MFLIISKPTGCGYQPNFVFTKMLRNQLTSDFWKQIFFDIPLNEFFSTTMLSESNTSNWGPGNFNNRGQKFNLVNKIWPSCAYAGGFDVLDIHLNIWNLSRGLRRRTSAFFMLRPKPIPYKTLDWKVFNFVSVFILLECARYTFTEWAGFSELTNQLPAEISTSLC